MAMKMLVIIVPAKMLKSNSHTFAGATKTADILEILDAFYFCIGSFCR